MLSLCKSSSQLAQPRAHLVHPTFSLFSTDHHQDWSHCLYRRLGSACADLIHRKRHFHVASSYQLLTAVRPPRDILHPIIITPDPTGPNPLPHFLSSLSPLFFPSLPHSSLQREKTETDKREKGRQPQSSLTLIGAISTFGAPLFRL